MTDISMLRKSAPTILSIGAMLGVIATAVLAVKATPKAEQKLKKKYPDGYSTKEAVQTCWKDYVPAASVGTATIVCIASANILNKKNQALLLSGYSLVKEFSEKYQGKVKELFGEEAHQQVMDAIVKDDCNFQGITSYDICGGSSLGIESMDPEVKRTFYDPFSKRYFESTLSNVIQAEYHLNRNYTLGGAITLAEFYEFLGLDFSKEDERLGWDMSGGISWLDFDHKVTTLDDGMEVVVIEMIFLPELFEEEAGEKN